MEKEKGVLYFRNKIKRLAEVNYSINILSLKEFQPEKDEILLELDSYGIMDNKQIVDEVLAEFYYKQCEILLGAEKTKAQLSPIISFGKKIFRISLTLTMMLICAWNMIFGMSYFLTYYGKKELWLKMGIQYYGDVLWLLPISILVMSLYWLWFFVIKLTDTIDN